MFVISFFTKRFIINFKYFYFLFVIYYYNIYYVTNSKAINENVTNMNYNVIIHHLFVLFSTISVESQEYNLYELTVINR